MEANEKSLMKLIAKTLVSNKVTIQNYDFDEAMDILKQNNYNSAALKVFEQNAFQVYMELMRIETVNSIHNSLRPM